MSHRWLFRLCLSFAVTGSLALEAHAVEIVGHRGASHDAPENTVAAARLAWEQDADAVEIDVHLSKDHEIVVIHDKTTKRIGGLDRPVVEQTLAELKQLDVGAWKDPKYAGERIPTLAEILATIPDGKRLFIEIKCGPEIVGLLEKELKKSGKQSEQTAVISFSLETVQAVKKQMPQLEVYWIVALEQDKETKRWGPPLEELIDKTKSAGLDGLDLGKLDIVDRDYIQKVRRAGLKICCWTVNDEALAGRLVDGGMQAITTDRPGWLRDRLAGKRDK